MAVRKSACTDEGEADYSALGSGIAVDPQTPAQTVTTGVGGTIQATVSTGAYLVCEQSSDNVTNAAGEKVTVIAKASPFVVTAPTPHPGCKGWLYNVHVYPKNTILEASTIKTEVTKPGLKQENGVSVDIDVTIPSLGDDHFRYFAIVDHLPAGMETPTDYTVQVLSKSDGGDQTVATLEKDRDYTVHYNSGSPQNNAVAVSFTRTGFPKLYPHANKTVRVSFKTTMNTLPPTGQVNNAAWVYMDRASLPSESQIPGVPYSWPSEPGGEPQVSGSRVPPLRTKNIVGLT